MFSRIHRQTGILRFASILGAVAMVTGLPIFAAPADLSPLRGLEEVSHAQVELRGGFWELRLNTQHYVTVPHALFSLEKDGQRPIKATAIPYYAWANREQGAMTVWIQAAAKP